MTATTATTGMNAIVATIMAMNTAIMMEIAEITLAANMQAVSIISR